MLDLRSQPQWEQLGFSVVLANHSSTQLFWYQQRGYFLRQQITTSFSLSEEISQLIILNYEQKIVWDYQGFLIH